MLKRKVALICVSSVIALALFVGSGIAANTFGYENAVYATNCSGSGGNSGGGC